jgi:hypothetical protein
MKLTLFILLKKEWNCLCLEPDFTAEEIQASLLLLLDWNIGILQSHHHLGKP